VKAVHVRTAGPADLDAALDVVAAAFVEEPDVVDLVRDLAGAGAFDDGVALLAEDDGRPVGFVLITPAAVEGSAVPLGCLAPLGVVPAYQKTGVGSALVREALASARERGTAAVLVLGHPAYYPRFGFVPAFARGMEPPVPVPDEHRDAWMVAELVDGALGGERGAVRLSAPLEDPQYW
jgi:putative acetyltransferase